MTTIQIMNIILIVILVLIALLGFIAVLLIFKMRNKDESNKSKQIKEKPKENVNLM